MKVCSTGNRMGHSINEIKLLIDKKKQNRIGKKKVATFILDNVIKLVTNQPKRLQNSSIYSKEAVETY